MIQARIAKRVAPGPDSPGLSLDFEFQAGPGITALFGAAGAGKTLALDTIAGFARPDAGRIMLDDRILFDAASRVQLKPQQRNCGYVLQNDALFPHLTIRENLVFAADRLPRLERHRRVNETLERFQLAQAAGRRPQEASRSEQSALLTGAWDHLFASRLAVGRADAMGWMRLPVRNSTGWCAVFGAIYRSLFCWRLTSWTNASSSPIRCCCCKMGGLRKADGRAKFWSSRRVWRSPGCSASRTCSRRRSPRSTRDATPAGCAFEEYEFTGTYFPGHLRGDRVWLCVRAGDLRVTGRNGARPEANQVPAKLLRVSDMPQSVQLEFSGAITVEVAPQEFERQKDNKEWLVEFPPAALRVL